MLRPTRRRQDPVARRYASWYQLAPLLRRGHKHYTQGRDRPDWHTIVYTPTVSATPRIIDKELCDLSANLSVIRTPDPFDARSLADPHASSAFVELLIVDEADRLKTPGLEQLRDHYDRSQLGMILIGMPGIESAWPATHSCTAGSASSTSIRRCLLRS